MTSLSLVTGANGHLGNAIVRELVAQGCAVRAGVRNAANRTPFDGLAHCELVALDITDAGAMARAMAGVDVVYAVAAVFKLWAHDAQKEIYDVNMDGTRILMRCAAAAGVRRVVYVSSILALNASTATDTGAPITEAMGYNPRRHNVYSNSKNDSDRLALQLGQDLDLDVVLVLPGALVGPECWALNDSYRVLAELAAGKLPLDPNINMSWCDVRDVARATVAAAAHGRRAQRYILAQERATSLADTLRILQDLYPDRKLKVPVRPPRAVMRALAWCMERAAARTHSRPLLQTAFVDQFWGVPQDFDTAAARADLGLRMKPTRDTIRDAVDYLDAHPSLTAPLRA
ncbi:MAG: hypothetical protein M1826_000756 [Phylliscum demangeonii]|nr:MAG: hypothetical protein M1826_000756 [Phylliscum demangeonii]